VMVNAYSGFTGFTPVITLGCSTPGLVCAFNPATVQPGGSSALTVTGLGGMATSGSIPLTITGTATGLSALTKAVVANNGDFALTGPSRALEPVLPGDPESFPLQMNSLNGLGGAYIAACGSGLSFACSTTPAQVAVISGGVSGTQVTVSGAAGPGPVQVPVTVSVSQGGATLSHSLSIPVNLGDFSVTAQPTAQTVKAGAVTGFGIYFHDTPGLNGKVNLSCSGLPHDASCQVNNPVLLFDGVNVGVGIITSTGQSPGARAASAGAGPAALAAMGLGLGLLAAWLAGPRRRVWVLAGAIVLGSMACGGGGAGGGGGGGGG